MKATVLESANGRCVILAEDGMFYSVYGDHLVGDTIEYKTHDQEKRFMNVRGSIVSKAAAIAACLVLLLSGVGYSYQNLMVYANVTLESEMPVLWRLNRKHEVIKIESVDKSGAALAANMSRSGIKGETIEQALSYAEKYIKKYSKSGKNAEFTVVVDCKNEKEKEELSLKLNEAFGGEGDESDGTMSSSESGSGKSDGDKAGEETGKPSGQTTEVTPAESGKKPAEASEESQTPSDNTPAAESEDNKQEETAPAEESQTPSDEGSDAVDGQEMGSQETSEPVMSSQEVSADDADEADEADAACETPEELAE